MDHTGNEFPCKNCKKRIRPYCVYSLEDDWDWSTYDVCPGFVYDWMVK